ncbi:uroporphyrinogen-III synthase [Vibrio sinaloensis]|uniref:uroporphyrinogen-III synthase n=1 Tax=Photobacterium sp. (strain ATCC 43367) TaxID=379097 RepID=UPI0035E4991F
MAVLVTRPGEQGKALCRQLTDAGMLALHHPVISIQPGDQLTTLASCIEQCDYIIAVSQHAVTFSHQVLQHHHQLWPDRVIYLAVGQKTAHVLSKVTQQKVHYPEIGDSEHLLMLDALTNVMGKKIVILRGNGGRELIFDTLIARGAKVEYVEAYKRENIAFRSELLVPIWQDKRITQLVITSSGQLEYFISQFSEPELLWLYNLTLYVPSERIVQEALTLGFNKVFNTNSASNNDLLAALQSTATGQ